MDNTGSMSSYLNEGKKWILRIIKEFEEKYKKTECLEFAYVGYRDHDGEGAEWDTKYPIKSSDFSNGTNCKNFMEGITCGGGGDTPEALVDAFIATNKLNWKAKSIKFMFHIADAPPHGSKYTSGIGDSFPGGCPCGNDMLP